jgi:flagellar basal-body rod protein FlgG
LQLLMVHLIEQPDGSIAYTRNGNFQLSVNTSGGLTLSTSDGYAVLDSTGNPITFDANVDTTKLTFDNYGNIKYVDATGNAQNLGIAIGIAQYNNPAGLEKMGDSYFKESVASGTPRIEGQDANLQRSVVKNGYLESSSVQAVDEMVDMIVTQRAYEMNSKAITASDEMLQQANNLRS